MRGFVALLTSGLSPDIIHDICNIIFSYARETSQRYDLFPNLSMFSTAPEKPKQSLEFSHTNHEVTGECLFKK